MCLPWRRVALFTAATCPACGTPNEPRLFFCKTCGASLALPANPSPEGAPSGAPGTPALPAATVPFALHREADLAAILNDTFRVFFRDWWVYWLPTMGLTFFTSLGSTLFFVAPQRAFISELSSPTLLSIYLGDTLDFVLLNLAFSLIGGSILQACLSHYAVRKHRRQQVGLAATLARGVAKFPSVILAACALTVLSFLLGLVAGFIVAVSILAAGLAGLCFGIVILILVVVGIATIEVAVSLYAPIIMTEDAGAIDSLVRSGNLTKGHRWSLFGAYIILGMFGLAMSTTLSVVLRHYADLPLSLIITAASSGLTASWILIAQAVGYSLLTSPSPAVQTVHDPVDQVR